MTATEGNKLNIESESAFDNIQTLHLPEQLGEKHTWKGFRLEYGRHLPALHIAYTTYGQLNAAGDNVVWVFHAFTANSVAHDWWDGLVGKGKLIDTDRYFVVCANTPGSHYGSIGPLDINPETNEPYYHDFPFFTIKDIVKTFSYLKDFLGIKKIHLGIGGSMGGQQLLEWAINEPELFEHIVPIATNAIHSPWGIAFNTSQRMAIEADNTWLNKTDDAGLNGMKAARSIALISYRSYQGYGITQSRNDSQWTPDGTGESRGGAASYQRYQGQKLTTRYNAFSYYFLSKTMDSHNVGRFHKSIEAALQQIKAKCLVVGIDSDVLFPLSEQQFLATHIPNAELAVISSQFGHDGFLLEFKVLDKIISQFLSK